MKAIKLVLIDDHQIIRDGIKSIFEKVAEIDIIADAGSGDELMEILTHLHVDVILMDIHLPGKNGIEIVYDIKAKYPDIKIIMNTLSESPDEIEAAVAAGIHGYVLKKTGTDELVKAIQMVAAGQRHYGAAVLTSFIKQATKKKPTSTKGLTETEIKIVQMLYDEKTQREIAEEMNVRPATITSHCQNMFRKLNTRSEIGLIKFALKEKLIG